MLPAGSIILWFGAIVNIPSGYVLCDGNDGTPNLQNKFIVGAGDTYAVDAVGGSVDHTHFFLGSGHTHAIGAGASIAAGAGRHNITVNANVSGQTIAGPNLPPFHALAYIMKT